MAEAVARFVADPAIWSAASRAGAAAARLFTYRAYQSAVAGLFAETWGVRLPWPPGDASEPAVAAPLNGYYSRNGHNTH
jgi:hypothetical protein